MAAPVAPPLSICSFNVQWVGGSAERDNDALARIVGDCDVVVVQEVIAPPYDMTYPDGEPARGDAESAAFFDAMRREGFAYELSPEDTGTGERIHNNGTRTEWFVAFYKPEAVVIDRDLPHGFLAEDRSDNPAWERVPFAVGFSAVDGRFDFVLISVHLKPGEEPAAETRRGGELLAIAKWIDANDEVEKDFIVLGDMNIEDRRELSRVLPDGFVSLNDKCRRTNTNVCGPKPYDHVFYRREFTTEIDEAFGLKVIDLVKAAAAFWGDRPGLYPGDPYDHDRFRKVYSDHHPIVFRVRPGAEDDD